MYRKWGFSLFWELVKSKIGWFWKLLKKSPISLDGDESQHFEGQSPSNFWRVFLGLRSANPVGFIFGAKYAPKSSFENHVVKQGFFFDVMKNNWKQQLWKWGCVSTNPSFLVGWCNINHQIFSVSKYNGVDTYRTLLLKISQIEYLSGGSSVKMFL